MRDWPPGRTGAAPAEGFALQFSGSARHLPDIRILNAADALSVLGTAAHQPREEGAHRPSSTERFPNRDRIESRRALVLMCRDPRGCAATKANTFGSGFGRRSSGSYVGIEQPFRHSRISRTCIKARVGSISISRCGDDCIASMSACPVTSPVRCRKKLIARGSKKCSAGATSWMKVR
jgi:hypothetical protein